VPANRNSRADNLTEREQAVAARVGELHEIDFLATQAVSNIYRVASAVRNRMERDVLSLDALSWTGFTALFVLWVWGPQEARHLAEECGVSKGTMTGIATTLETKGLISRNSHPEDGRLVLIDLTKAGKRTIERLFPVFNKQEAAAAGALSLSEQSELARLLRKMLVHVEGLDEPNTFSELNTEDNV
jgi:MarR family transcriptional regulator, organic hydroperoxide resistance regulator